MKKRIFNKKGHLQYIYVPFSNPIVRIFETDVWLLADIYLRCTDTDIHLSGETSVTRDAEGNFYIANALFHGYSALLNLPLIFCQNVFFGGGVSAGPLKLLTLRM